MGDETDRAGPAPLGGGPACIAWLDARLFGRGPGADPGPELRAWLEATALRGDGAGLRGLDPAGLDDATFAALRAAGAPLAPAGELRWDRDVVIGQGLTGPEEAAGVLRLPPPARLAACNAVELQPLRAFFGHRLGLRLQAAPRIACYLWGDRSLLVSTHRERLAGFLHGPGDDRRHVLAWEPEQALVVTW